MSIGPNSRLAISIAILVLLITSLALLSRASNSRSQQAAQDSRTATKSQPLAPIRPAVAKSAQRSESRDVEDNIPKHLPVAVHLRAEKEQAAKDIKNEKWVRDFELEVKNTGDKPIYFIRFDLVPDFGRAPTERTPGLTLEYGREDLVDFTAPLTPQDVPIKPGEKVFIKIRDEEMDGWDHIKQVENWPEKWSKPNKVRLYFEILNFGDGTGFDGPDGAPHERQKPPQAELPDGIEPLRPSSIHLSHI